MHMNLCLNHSISKHFANTNEPCRTHQKLKSFTIPFYTGGNRKVWLTSSNAFSCSSSGYSAVVCANMQVNTHSECQWSLHVFSSTRWLGEMAATEALVHGQGTDEATVSSSKFPCMDNRKTRTVLYTMKDTHPAKLCPKMTLCRILPLSPN